MWVVALVVVALILAVVIFRVLRTRPVKRDNYVCNVCGEHECLCHKEEKGG